MSKAEGARGVNSRGTTLLARQRMPRISRLLPPWAPPTRTYLTPILAGTGSFFGRPLEGAFGVGPDLPGFHRPWIACAETTLTSPRQRGLGQPHGRPTEKLACLRRLAATVYAPASAPVAVAESGRGTPRIVLLSSRDLQLPRLRDLIAPGGNFGAQSEQSYEPFGVRLLVHIILAEGGQRLIVQPVR